MLQWSLQQEHITLVNIYIPNIAHKYIMQILEDTKGGIDSNIIMGIWIPHLN